MVLRHSGLSYYFACGVKLIYIYINNWFPNKTTWIFIKLLIFPQFTTSTKLNDCIQVSDDAFDNIFELTFILFAYHVKISELWNSSCDENHLKPPTCYDRLPLWLSSSRVQLMIWWIQPDGKLFYYGRDGAVQLTCYIGLNVFNLGFQRNKGGHVN